MAQERKSKLTFGSLFAGIGGFDSGFEAAGMRCLWQVEIDDACNRVLERHWPGVRRYRDVKEVGGHNLERVDLICGGFPCQDLSVAGRRAGLAGERSGLFFEFMRIIDELSPAWVVIENVPGLLSSAGGGDMATVLGTLAKLGYGYAYRVLDAQYFGVAQRRRRVFIVGHLGKPWSAPAKVLFEPESYDWDSPPSREKKSLSASLLASGAGTSRPAGIGSEADFLVTQALTGGFEKDGPDDNLAQGGFLVPETAKAVNTSTERMDGTVETFVIQDAAMPRDKKQNGIGITAGGPCYTLDGHGAHAVAHTLRAEGCDASEDGTDRGTPIVAVGFQERSDLSHALRANPSKADKPDSTTYVASSMAVRRLTPLECERLQGFPDGWTAGESDAARYKMLGNAVCRKVSKWLGKRIVEVAEA
ncbi:MAG: DNA cytosine methyltransferase [Syntrophothermus sp.]|uniref:DNA cytosine methyltransferase n=1 Tax=Syntrophothermus sp. TaxID=2736299 RepID=UPI00257DC9B5|nr:DNA cytosine methyltransferase [Syntrophothermus sp.]NSW84083.1 DNA cytosine methyltransferase [Syntrophothermus sp.]